MDCLACSLHLLPHSCSDSRRGFRLGDPRTQDRCVGKFYVVQRACAWTSCTGWSPRGWSWMDGISWDLKLGGCSPARHDGEAEEYWKDKKEEKEFRIRLERGNPIPQCNSCSPFSRSRFHVHVHVTCMNKSR
jgi:hypothetical protein